MTHAPDDYALVIGINHYPNWAKGAKSLKGAIRDAEDFHTWLVNPKGGGLLPHHARLILSQEIPLAPLQQVIDQEFDAIRQLSKDQPRRRFYFYFSGHGHSPAMSQGRQALCLANWSLEYPGAALQLESYLNASLGCLNFEEGLFFLDCCRVRESTPLGKSSDLECGDPKLEGKQYITYYAAEHYRAGYESQDEDVHGYFSRALIAILDAGPIEALDLERRLGKDVLELAKGKNQVARALRYADREIVLGPPIVPPQPDDGHAPPSAQATLEISLDTRLSTKAIPGEPPPPAPGSVAVYRDEAMVGFGRGSYEGLLPLGSYLVQVTHGEANEQHQVELKGDIEIVYPLPRRVSAAPLSGTVDKREIITDPIVAASRRASTDNQSIEGQSIFIAHRMKNTPLDGNFRGQLRIDSYGLLDAEISDGRNLFPAHPGTYTIRYSEEGAAPLCLSLPVAAGWDTQIFFVEDRGRPILERASVFMQPAGKGFDPSDALIDAYELALADLVSGGPGPDQLTLDMLLNGKFKNPLFGLVGAHFLVRELRMDRTKPPARLWLLDLVIENMGKLLGPNSADVLALKLLRGQLTGIPYEITGTPPPPLLRASLLALIDATAEQPQLFETLFDEIAIGQVADSPWCCWREAGAAGEASTWEQYPEDILHHNVLMQYGPRSEAIEKLLTAEEFTLVAHDENGLRRIRAQGAARKDVTDYSAMERLVSTPDWVVDAVREEMLQSARTERPINMARLVTRLGLPRGVLEQALRIVEQDVVPAAATGDTLLGLTADIVAAHVARNSVDAGDMSELVASVHRTLTNLSTSTDTAVPEPQPAVSIRDSVTPDYIVCLEDGKKLKMLKRHLMTHYHMTPADYRAKWKLPADYPMIAPNYAARRKELAIMLGLGRELTERPSPKGRRRRPKSETSSEG